MPDDFQQDLAALPERIPTACRDEWRVVYNALSASVSPLARALKGSEGILAGWVREAEQHAGRPWPANTESARTLLLLCRKGKDGFEPGELLANRLDELPFNVQLWLRRCGPEVIEEVLVYNRDFAPYQSEEAVERALTLLVHTNLPTGVPLAGLAEHVAVFVARHDGYLQDRMYDERWARGIGIDDPHIPQRAFEFYHRFRFRRIPDVAPDDPFYDRSFDEVMRYAPLLSWVRGHYNRQFAGTDIVLGDENWLHLAGGGSWRKLPDGRPVSRGMARILAEAHNHPRLPLFVDDHYLAAYAVNLGGSPELCHAAAHFLRRYPDDPTAQTAEFQRWERMLQVVDNLGTERQDVGDRAEFTYQALEYLAPRLRENPDLELPGYTAERLLEDIAAAEERREQRLIARREREALKRADDNAQDVIRWPAYTPLHQPTGLNPDGKRIQFFELNSETALNLEGEVMGHCVSMSGYGFAYASGRGRLFSLREYDEERARWNSVATLFLDRSYIDPTNYRLRECRGRFNSSLKKWAKQVVEYWLEEQGFEDDYFY